MHYARLHKSRRTLQLTSLIDVVFLLIVFFMLTSSFLRTESLEMSLPSGAASATPSEDGPIILVVADRERLFLHDEAIERTDLVAQVQALLESTPERQIMVMSTNNVTVQELISVMDDVYQAGGKAVSVSYWKY